MKTPHLSIIVIVISFGTYCAFAQYPAISYNESQPTNDLGNGGLLSITTTKNAFSAGDIIDIHGNSLPNYHVELTLVGPNGTIKDFRSTFSDRDGQFSSYLQIPKYAEGGIWKILGKSGTYAAELDFDIFEPQLGTCQGCHPNIPQSQNNNVTLLSPLKQFKSGIISHDVKCKEGFMLITKASDGSPACVKIQMVQKFIDRGWGTMPTKNQIKFLIPGGVVDVSKLPPMPANPPIRNATSQSPLPELKVTPTISPVLENTKILSIGMSPNPLKVGDTPSFTLTYQNISSKPIYHVEGCGSSLAYRLSPEVNVQETLEPARGCNEWETMIQPNQVITDGADSGNILYKILRPGTLNVTMALALRTPSERFTNFIQFQINALNEGGIVNASSIVSSQKPDVIKILAIGMSPNPLKVGDDVGFTVTFKNVSNKLILVSSGCGPSPVSYTISPASYVKQFPAITHELGCAAQVGPLAPNQTFTADAIAVGGYYQIIKAGNLNVNITVRSALVTGNWPQSANSTAFTTAIQFNVTATQ